MLINLKKDLRRIRPVMKTLEIRRERLEILRDLAYTVPAGIGGDGSHSHATDTMERRIINAADYERELGVYVQEHAGFLANMEQVVGSLSKESELESLIQLRYYKGCSWRQVAYSLCFSEPHVYRLHCDALLMMLPVYDSIFFESEKIL